MIFSRVFMKHGDYKSAFQEMEKVLDLSIMAFTKVKKFEHKVKCKWLSISCRLMILCYDKREEVFQSLSATSLTTTIPTIRLCRKKTARTMMQLMTTMPRTQMQTKLGWAQH